MRPAVAVVGSFVALSLCAVLTGCGVSDPAPSGPVALPALHGTVYGGQQGISGAKVYLYAAGETGTSTTGYGANATSLLNSPGYVTSNSDGSWSLTSDYNLSAC